MPSAAVPLVAPNGPQWTERYAALLDEGAVPLLLDADTPVPEQRRWLALAPPQPLPGTVLLCTSGTTGAPKVVARSRGSLAEEGRRLAKWTQLSGTDRVLLPLPMWHAYALGWVHAAWEAGCALDPVPPAALRRTVQAVDDGATVLPLTPGLASLLAGRGGVRPDHRLRLAMVGAGPVTTELEDRFRKAFGIGLARNYGSTETGALFSGAPGLPPGCVGQPMSGVSARLTGPHGEDVPPGEPGELLVRTGAGDWHRTGDLARWSADGLHIIGRNSRAVRRGDRWVAPEEIESVLLSHPAVVDARCVAGPTALEAEVVGVRAEATDLAPLRGYLGGQLAPHKVPERLRLVGEVPHGPSGKRVQPRTYAPADPLQLIECAQAYRRSELLFALLRLGILDELGREPADAPAVARALGLDPQACDLLLRTAEELGLLTAADPAPVDVTALRPLLELEAALSRSWVTREPLAEAARDGYRERDPEAFDPQFRETYQRAMHSPAARQRVRAGLGLSRYRPGQRLLEITCGPGRYATGDAALLRTGALSPTESPARQPEPGERFDVVVVCNAVHLPRPGSDLAALADRLADGGRLLVDDVFLDTGLPPAVRLDWLTHGGLYWSTVDGLTAGLNRAGLAVTRAVPVGSPPATLLVAERAR